MHTSFFSDIIARKPALFRAMLAFNGRLGSAAPDCPEEWRVPGLDTAVVAAELSRRGSPVLAWPVAPPEEGRIRSRREGRIAMLCSEILRSVSGKLQDEDADARRWPWESASGAYSLMDSLNAAVREIVTQRPDATALTEPMRLELGMMQRIPRADIHMTSRNAVSLINVIQNFDPDGNTPGRPVFRVELDALRTAAAWGKAGGRVENWAYSPLDNREAFWVYPGVESGRDVWIEAVYSAEPVRAATPSDRFPLPESFANAAYLWMLFDVLAGDHSESNFAKAQAFLQAFAQSLGVKLQTDLAFPIRQGGVNDAQA